MKERFICPAHRQWLSAKPSRAFHCWSNAFETATLLYERQNWEAALPQAGCAFEASEIILSKKITLKVDAMEIYAASAQLYTNTLLALHRLEDCKDALRFTIERLIRELQPSEDFLPSSLKARITDFRSRLQSITKFAEISKQRTAVNISWQNSLH